MLPSLFLLLAVTILGGAIYMYLYQEQDRYIKPKDEYDEVWDEVFWKRQKKRGLNAHLEAILKNTSSSTISLGLGLISFASLIFYFDEFVIYAVLISCVGSFAAIAGLFIGVYGMFQARNKSPIMRYGGMLLNIIGLMNLINFGGFLLLGSFFGWLVLTLNS